LNAPSTIVGTRDNELRECSLQAADTTGAGDAFVGALACRLRAGDDLTVAAGFATEVASVSVTKPGTMPSYPTTAQLGQEPAAAG